MCVGVFVRLVNRGYTYTRYTSTGDAPAIGNIPSSKKALMMIPPPKKKMTIVPIFGG